MVARKQTVVAKTANDVMRGDMFDIGGLHYKVVDIKSNNQGDKVFEMSRASVNRKTIVIIDGHASIMTTVTRR
jgi:ActR/RegA family two-component response regulator